MQKDLVHRLDNDRRVEHRDVHNAFGMHYHQATADGQVVIRHDASLDKSTNGSGLVSEHTLVELRQLDAGSWFDASYKDERIPTLREALELCHGKIDLMLDLK